MEQWEWQLLQPLYGKPNKTDEKMAEIEGNDFMNLHLSGTQ